ncbi:MAG: hypothetical protein ACI8RZ_005479 [Myxococcota bacterium]|jgi:hypothetical protein
MAQVCASPHRAGGLREVSETMEPTTQSDPDTLRRLLDRLEPFSSHPGTIEIHDPLYFMLRDPSEVHLANLTAALKAFPNHPLAAEVLSAFGEAVEAGPLTLASVLAEDGPIPVDVDPIREVQRRFRRHGETRAVLDARIQELERNHDRMITTTNAMTSLAAILAMFTLLGWLAALGVWEIPWLDPQEVIPEEPEEGAGG